MSWWQSGTQSQVATPLGLPYNQQTMPMDGYGVNPYAAAGAGVMGGDGIPVSTASTFGSSERFGGNGCSHTDQCAYGQVVCRPESADILRSDVQDKFRSPH